MSDGTELLQHFDLPTPKHCGTWRDGSDFDPLSIVTQNGGSFIALIEIPCPGPGWSMMAARGRTGEVSSARMEQAIAHLEHRANARSVSERLRAGLASTIADLQAEHPKRLSSRGL